MEFSKVVSERRSIRVYDSTRTITKEQIEELIKTASLAPSWKNSQTARYYVALSDEMKAKVVDCMPDFNKDRCKEASAIIVTAFVTKRSGFNREGIADNELGDSWGAYDLGLANENLLLKATDMGLSTLIMGLRDSKKLAEIFNIPETQQVVSVISVGYAKEAPEMPKRKAPEDICVIM